MTVNTTSKGPSACETQCQSQQEALTACMNAIRDARETVFHNQEKRGSGGDSDGSSEDCSSTDIGKVDSSCLAPSVASWTECCSKANSGSVEVNEGHIGI